MYSGVGQLNVMSTRVTVHMILMWKCACAYILQNLLEDTSTALALTLLSCTCVGAESVLQNCVMGRCANLHIGILLYPLPGTKLNSFKILDPLSHKAD